MHHLLMINAPDVAARAIAELMTTLRDRVATYAAADVAPARWIDEIAPGIPWPNDGSFLDG